MSELPAAVLAIAAVLVAVGTIWRYVFPALRGAWRLAHGTAKLIEDFRDTGGFGGLATQNADLALSLAAVKKELYPNGGSSLRDSVMRTEQGLRSIAERTTELAERISVVSEKAKALGERQEVLRAADQEFARELQQYIESRHTDLLAANEGLRAALNESLMIDEEGL